MNTEKWTPEASERLVKYLNREGYVIPASLGTDKRACSIGAINIALTGRLSDCIPRCMSPVIGIFIMNIQDAVSEEMRNRAEWKELLPLAADTGREHTSEKLRALIIRYWMWSTVFPHMKGLANSNGAGDSLNIMLEGGDEKRLSDDLSDLGSTSYYMSRSIAKMLECEAAWDDGLDPVRMDIGDYDLGDHDYIDKAAVRTDKSVARSSKAVIMAAQTLASAALARDRVLGGYHIAYDAAWQKFDPISVLNKMVQIN